MYLNEMSVCVRESEYVIMYMYMYIYNHRSGNVYIILIINTCMSVNPLPDTIYRTLDCT